MIPPSADAALLEHAIHRFAERVLEPNHELLNRSPSDFLTGKIVTGLHELGLLGDMATAELDGSCANETVLAGALEALSFHSPAAAVMAFTHWLAQDLLRRSGVRDSRRFLAANGEERPRLLAYPVYAEMERPEPTVRARRLGETLEIRGIAELVVNAPAASALVTPVSVEGEGVGLLLVSTAELATSASEPVSTLGMRACPVADVRFDGLSVRADSSLIPTERAKQLLEDTARRFRGPAVAIGAGILRSSFQHAFTYCRQRIQGGRAIIEHQQVRTMLAGLFEARTMLRDVAERLSRASVPEPAATALFLSARQVAGRAARDGVQLLGGYGYMEDFPQERSMRDAKQAECLLGRTDLLRQYSLDAWLESPNPMT